MADRPIHNTRPYLVAAILGTMSEDKSALLFDFSGFTFHQSNSKPWTEKRKDTATTEEMIDAFEYLVNMGYVHKIDDTYTGSEYTITDTGRSHYFNARTNPSTLEARYAQRGISWLRTALTNIHNDNLQDEPEHIPEDTQSPVPAADRYVNAKDNQEAFNELKHKVSELQTAVREHRSNDFYDKEGRLGELAALELALAQPLISVPLVEKILSETVRYLATKFADNAIGIAAQAVMSFATHAFLNGIHL